jgi:hypothetical protein
MLFPNEKAKSGLMAYDHGYIRKVMRFEYFFEEAVINLIFLAVLVWPWGIGGQTK